MQPHSFAKHGSRHALLGHSQTAGRTVPEVSDPAVRELFVGRYRLLYRVLENEVQILAFIHGAQDFDGLVPER